VLALAALSDACTASTAIFASSELFVVRSVAAGNLAAELWVNDWLHHLCSTGVNHCFGNGWIGDLRFSVFVATLRRPPRALTKCLPLLFLLLLALLSLVFCGRKFGRLFWPTKPPTRFCGGGIRYFSPVPGLSREIQWYIASALSRCRFVEPV